MLKMVNNQGAMVTVNGDQKESRQCYFETVRDVFAWKSSEVPGIDPKFCCHKLGVYPSSAPVSQRKRNLGPEKRKALETHVQELLEAGFMGTKIRTRVTSINKIMGITSRDSTDHRISSNSLHLLCLCQHHLLDQPYVHLDRRHNKQASSSGGGGSSLEDMMKQFGNNTLPSQTIPNPKGNVSAISLRSGKQLEEPKPAADVTSTSERESETVKIDSKNKKAMQQGKGEDIPIPIPFPQKAIQSKRLAEKAQEKDILETFRRVEINIPLLDAVKQIPKYAKFLKELCTNKRRLKGNERVSLNQNVSALIQPTMPRKCKDPGTFSIPCLIDGLGPLRPTGVIVQLANRSSAHPSGLVEDVLVKVNDLIFPADFYILDMESESPSSRSPIILGRPFMKTVRTKIDVHSGTLSMEFGDISVNFNIFDAMKHPREEHL
ncbi:hypothetical protein K1719_041066 [Acacia pycnantha]|nr:hypothetical protein K1719_041066 [Acacia pycnantha]